MKGKLKELRESRRLTQAGMGSKVGVSQQNISKYEKDACNIPVDMLIQFAEYFNVTTDYLLGVSDVKRNFEKQLVMSKSMDEYYDLIEMYRNLEERDREIVWLMMEQMCKISAERNKEANKETN